MGLPPRCLSGIGAATAAPPCQPTCCCPLSDAAAAVMIADVSGFTALTEALGAQGSAGVEKLTKCMNRYFTRVSLQRDVHAWAVCRQHVHAVRGMVPAGHADPAANDLACCTRAAAGCQVIDLLLLYGGDVEKFAGDCMIVVFAPTPSEAQGGCGEVPGACAGQEGALKTPASLSRTSHTPSACSPRQARTTAVWRQPPCGPSRAALSWPRTSVSLCWAAFVQGMGALVCIRQGCSAHLCHTHACRRHAHAAQR